jgi:pyruvate formate-lyase activating enzyme-like uncharacterized protein
MLVKNLNISSGALSNGCAFCLMGKKMTLFITGICPNKCYYCPVGSNKMGSDLIYANERPIKSTSEAIQEAKDSGAWGTAITGGEPLVVVDRVIEYIKALKSAFGPNHHIHLYSGFPNLTNATARRLYDAGLDEIRFHIIATEGVENSLREASKFGWRVGVELPALLNLDYVEVAKRAKRAGAKFMILDEYEINEENSFATIGHFDEAGSKNAILSLPKKEILNVIERIRGILPVHYCTVKSKYYIQYRNRLVSSYSAKKYKSTTLLDDGTVIRFVGKKVVRFAPVYKEPLYEEL